MPSPAKPRSATVSLDPAMPVLLRPDGAVQVGWDPGRAVMVQPPRGLSSDALAAVLRTMRSTVPLDRVNAEARRLGAQDSVEVADMVKALVTAGVASEHRPRRRAARVRVHGRGPLSELLVQALRGAGVRVTHTCQPHVVVRPERTDLMVLTDFLIADPHLVRDLHRAGMPYLAVRVRDGSGLVGPLVIPGFTGCLDCADLYRSDRDAAWPALATQLRGTVGVADHGTALATVALALGQVQAVARAVGIEESRQLPVPSSLSATLQIDVAGGSIRTRHWPKHPGCWCAEARRRVPDLCNRKASDDG